MGTYGLFFLVAIAIGGVAWVFVYPLLSGEKKAERRMASVARSEPIAAERSARGGKIAARTGRRHAQGHRGAAEKGEAAAALGAA